MKRFCIYTVVPLILFFESFTWGGVGKSSTCKFVLSLNTYLTRVLEGNEELKSILANFKSVKEKLNEIRRVYSPFLDTSFNYDIDRGNRPIDFGLSQKKEWRYESSVSKQFVYGTKVSLGINGSYERDYYERKGDKPKKDRNVTDVDPFVRFQQSLWKNINGRYTKASIAQKEAKAKSTLYLLEYKKQKFLFDAVIAYWKLSYARVVLKFRELSLDRKKKFLVWNEEKYKMDLVKKADLLQAQASYKNGELNLILACEEERKASRNFNKFLNIADESVKYDLEDFNFKNICHSFNINESFAKMGSRADVLAALEDVNSALYEQKASQRERGADLILEGKYSLGRVDESSHKSFDHVKDFDKPSYYIGLKYTLPLDFKLRKAINKGYELAKISAQAAAKNAIVGENNDWIQLLDNWDSVRKRLKLAVEIEDAQRRLYEENRKLFKNGRTTTYMVLKSEEDLDEATIRVLKCELELVSIYEQAKVFYSGVQEVF